MTSRLRPARAALLLALAGACAPALDASLLRLDEVDAVATPGRPLRVLGEGFPAGAEGMLRLEGTMHAPAAAPAQASVELPARAQTERLAFGPEATALTTALGAGTFVGTLSLRFEAASGGVVRGERDVELRLEAPARWRAEREGQVAARAVGLTVDAAAGGGLDVLAVVPGSPGAEAGLAPGDRLERFGRVLLATPADLRWVPGAREARLRLRRGLREVTTTLARPEQRPRPGPRGALVALVALLALGLLVFGPLAAGLEGAREAALRRLETTPRRQVGRHVLAVMTGAGAGFWITAPAVPALVMFDAFARGAGALRREAPLASALAGAPSWGAWFLLSALADGGPALALRSPWVALVLVLALLGSGPAAGAPRSLDARRAVAASAGLALALGPGAVAALGGLALSFGLGRALPLRVGIPAALGLGAATLLAPGLLVAPRAGDLLGFVESPASWLATGGLLLTLGALIAPRRPRLLWVHADL